MVVSLMDRAVSPVVGGDFEPIVQFSLVLDTRILAFNSVLKSLLKEGVSILAVSFLENFETATIRCVVNYPDVARKIFSEKMIFYHETNVLAVEMGGADEMLKISSTISAAEMKMHYMYPFLARPGGKAALVVQTENNEFTANILSRTGIKIISQNDIGR